MSWWGGGGWGNRPSQSAKDVAEAFFAGKIRRRSNCCTDGESYWFISSTGGRHQIARRLKDNAAVVDTVATALEGRTARRLLEFHTRGWLTKTTARHLCALGLDAQCQGIKSPKFWINGRLKPDSWDGWFTLDDVNSWPDQDPDEVAWKQRCIKSRKFVQLTPSLFDWDDSETQKRTIP